MNVTGDTFTGAVNIETTGGPALTLKDTNSSGTAAAIYIDFDDSAGTRVGYVGIGSGGTNDNWFYSTSGKPILASGNGSAPQYYNGSNSTYNNIFHDGYHPNADAWTTARTLSLSGDASGSVSWDGSANATLSVTVADNSHAHDYVPERSRTDWNDSTVIDDVIGQLAWKNYGNNHTIFDASGGTAPGGTSKNNTNPDVTWTATYPTLMGWNGSQTYGVRVDASRYADQWKTARTLTLSGDASGSVSWNGSANATLSVAVTNDSHNHTNFTVSGITDLNSISGTASNKFRPFTSNFQASNRPAANYAGGFEIGVASSSDNYRGQLAFVAGGANEGPYVRTKTSGTWNSWNEVWHQGNDGSGSGLDADLLDGVHGSAFARKDSGVPDFQYGIQAGELYLGTDGDTDGDYNLTLKATGNNTLYLNHGGTGHVDSLNAIYAPQFYDRDNSSYYVDPASTSQIHGLRLLNGSNAVDLGNGDTEVDINYQQANSTWQVGVNNNYGNGGFFFYRNNSGYRAGLDTSANFYVEGSIRTAIYYENGNTAYYVDPSSTSNIYNLQTANQVVIGGTFSNNNYDSVSSTRLTFGGATNIANYYIGTNLNNYGGNYTKLDLAWHTGIRMGAQQQYGGIRLFDSESFGTRLFSVAEGDANVRVTNTLYAANYYDINNTSYYVDPYGTSNMSRVQAGDWFYAGGNSGIYFNTWGGGFHMTDTTWVRVYNGKSFYQASGTLRCDGDIRAPIFYDQNNTSYYVDPNGDSRMARLNISDGNNYIIIGDESAGFNTSYSQIRTTNTGALRIDSRQGQDLYLNWYNNSSTSIYTESSLRAPIYYDRNNSAYYVDPASTTVLNNLTINGTVTGISASATGGGSDNIFWENDQTVTTNYTITNGQNAMSAGPITINSGVTVTIGTGEAWTVV